MTTVSLIAQQYSPSSGLFSQTPKDWRLDLSYDQDNNIYFWRGNLASAGRLGKGRFTLADNLNINRINTSGDTDKWKDINNFFAQYTLPLSGSITSILTANSNYLSDRQTGFLNNISENSISARLPVLFRDKLHITPIAGYKWDKRIDTTDKGLQHGLDLTLYSTGLGEYYSEARGNYLNEKLDNRNNQTRNIQVNVNRSFYGEASDTLQFNMNNFKRDYYTSATGDLESRKEDIRSVFNKLYYNLSGWGNIKIETNFSAGNVDITSVRRSGDSQRRSRKDSRTEINVTLRMKAGENSGRLFLKYDKSKQDYENESGLNQVWGSVPFDIPDNRGEKIELGGAFEGRITQKQSYSLEGFAEKYSFNTPSDDNFDDHDELRFGFRGEYRFTFNPRLYLQFNSSASLDHLVYIFNERSADNNWNRIFQAGCNIYYENPGGLTLSGRYSVLANYVDYDFDLLFNQVRSFVFRKFSMNYLLRYPVTTRGELNARLQIDLEENGFLRWEEFTQNVIIDRKITIGSLGYKYLCTDRMSIEPGFTFFRRNEEHFNQSMVGTAGGRLTSITDNGVQLAFTYQVRSSARVRFNASKRFIKRGDKKEDLQYIDLAIHWLF